MSKVRVLLVGWDGAEPELINPWLSHGHLPVLAELAGKGAAGQILSTTPAVTPPAWTSLITGVDPGRHGIYSFSSPTAGGYSEQIVTAAERQAPSVWQYLSGAGVRVGVFNLSVSYPPEPVNGFLLAGFDSPVFSAQTLYPAQVFEQVTRGLGGYVHETVNIGRGAVYARALEQQMRQQRDLLRALTEAIPVEVLAVNFNACDHVHHRCWPLGLEAGLVVEAGDTPVRRTYQALDALLGDLLERYAGPQTTVLVVSDHGGGMMRGQVSLARALEEGGFLRRAPRRRIHTYAAVRHAARRLLPQTLKTRLWARWGSGFRSQMAHSLRAEWVAEVDWARTTAFPWGSSGFVQVNLRGHSPRGRVAELDRERVLADVTAYLRTLRDPADQRPVVEGVLRGEELYRPPRVGYVPDLLVEGAGAEYGIMPMWDARGPLFEGAVRNITLEGGAYRGVTANHRPWGVLITAGPTVPPRVQLPALRMEDLAPALLYLAGVPIPEGLDGRLAREVWDTGQEPLGQIATDARTTPTADYTAAEQSVVEQRLRDLGYV